MKILVVYRAIDRIAGGAEKMSATLINYFSQKGHNVQFLTFDKQDAVSFYELHQKVNWQRIGIGDFRRKATVFERLQRFYKARRTIKSFNPNVIIAFQHDSFLHSVLLNIFLNYPIIWAERVSPQYFNFRTNIFYRELIYQLARFAETVCIQNESYISSYPSYLKHKIAVIPNPVFPTTLKARPWGKKHENKVLLCVGRLDFQKNQKILVKAFLELQTDFPEWSLFLAGEGDEKGELLELIGNNNRIKMLGNVKNIGKLYAGAHLFCLPSRWEGFPNALAEALSHGLPAVGFDGCTGVSELIKDQKNGILARGNDNIDSLKQAIKTLMENGRLRRKCGDYAVSSMSIYNPIHQFEKWDVIIRDIKK